MALVRSIANQESPLETLGTCSLGFVTGYFLVPACTIFLAYTWPAVVVVVAGSLGYGAFVYWKSRHETKQLE